MIAVLRVVAFITAAAGVIVVMMAIDTGASVSLLLLITAGAGALMLYAVADGLQVILDMEEHQRALRLMAEAEYVERRRREVAA